MIAILPPCELLEWDSWFFRKRIARGTVHRLDEETTRTVENWCKRERIDCLYFLADADHSITVATAERHGFGMKDVRLTSRIDLELAGRAPRRPLLESFQIRPCQRHDLVDLEAISSDAFTFSRFSFDDRFPQAAVSTMYQLWIRKCVEKTAEIVLVLDHGGRAVGFITCHLLGMGEGEVQLAAIARQWRSKGLAKPLYEAALSWFANKGIKRVTYVTQARNISAQRLIQRLGFQTCEVQIWYHKWFIKSGLP